MNRFVRRQRRLFFFCRIAVVSFLPAEYKRPAHFPWPTSTGPFSCRTSLFIAWSEPIPVESSGIVALRACVMLGSLVALPLLAAFSGPVPERLREVVPPQIRPWLEMLSPPAAPPVAELPDASEFGIPSLTDQTAGDLRPGSPDSLPLRVMPVDASPSTGQAFAISQAAVSTNLAKIPDERLTSQGPAMATLEARLKRLGATKYHLEKWGGLDELYRFVCQFSVHGDPGCRRHLEATSADPLVAMETVLRQIEAVIDRSQPSFK